MLNLGNSCDNWLLAKCLDNEIADWNSGKGDYLKEQIILYFWQFGLIYSKGQFGTLRWNLVQGISLGYAKRLRMGRM